MSIKKESLTKLSAAIGIATGLATIPNSVLAEGFLIEEIVVMAQKRAESAQDIPVAITAVQAETLENMGIQRFTDLTKVSSSLTISDGDSRNSSPISLRGIGTFAFGMGVEPSVAVVIDDVPVARAAQAFSNLVDIERVEVLRGPQSTLFGKSASAGVISITTKAPSAEPESMVELTATDDNETGVVASTSGMLTETLGVRMSGYYSDLEGHIENLTDGEKLNGGIRKGVRTKVVWDAVDELSVTFIGEYNESDENCCARALHTMTENALALGFIPQNLWLTGLEPSSDNMKVRLDTAFQSYARDWATTLKLNYELGEHTITSITAFRDWDYLSIQDMDSTDVFELNQFSKTGTKLFTQELRLASPSSDDFQYVGGLYYTKVKNDKDFNRGPVFQSDWIAEAENESYALFGQADIGLTDDLTLIAGLRYNSEEISVEYERFQPDQLVITPRSDTDDVVTGKLALQYFLDEDIMLFGGYSRGYKGQGYDITSSFSQASAEEPVAPETSDAFEIGLKSTLFDSRLQLNATLFTTKYADFQAQGGSQDSETQTILLRLNNVGDLVTSGLEVDAIALLSDNFRMSLGFAYIDAEIKEFEGADCYDLQTIELGCINGQQNLSGEELNNSPDLKVNLAGEYVLPLNSMPFDGFVNFSYQWQDDFHFDLLANPSGQQDAYGIFNLSLGIRSKEDSYRATLFVNNLFDQSYLSNWDSYQGFFGGADVQRHMIPRGAQRYAGIRLKLDF